MYFINRRSTMLFFLLTAFSGYSFFLYTSLPVKNYIPEPLAIQGKTNWQKYNCNACHQVFGLGGYLGNDLTNIYSLRGPAYIKAFLKTGTTVMPDFKLSDAEIESLVAYLKDMDASGKADPRTFTIEADGTIKR